MDFITWSNVAFFSAAQGVLIGFFLYFAVSFACRMWDLGLGVRVALTILAIFAVMAKQVYYLIFQPEPLSFVVDEAMAPVALWLAIKVKFWAGIVGHTAGLMVEKRFA